MKQKLNFFVAAISAELLKSRRTLAFWLTLAYPLFAVGLATLGQAGIDFKDANPWARYVHNMGNLASFFLPFFIILLVGLYCHIEYRSNTWKHLIAQPLPYWAHYMGKMAMILVLLAFSILVFMVLALAGTIVLHASRQVFSFEKNVPDFFRLFQVYMKVYIASAVVITLQYWLSMRFRNLILPIVIGIGLTILPIAIVIVLGMAGLMKEMKLVEKVFSYDPYSYPFVHIFNFTKGPPPTVEIFPTLTLIYLGLALLIFTLGYFDFRSKNIK